MGAVMSTVGGCPAETVAMARAREPPESLGGRSAREEKRGMRREEEEKGRRGEG